MNFMQKKFFSLITSLTLILSSFVPFTVFAADEILAAFEYTAPDGTTSGTASADRDSSGGYGAASGVMKASAMLFASVNGEDYSELEWSETYDYGSDNRIPAPVMAACIIFSGIGIHANDGIITVNRQGNYVNYYTDNNTVVYNIENSDRNNISVGSADDITNGDRIFIILKEGIAQEITQFIRRNTN